MFLSLYLLVCFCLSYMYNSTIKLQLNINQLFCVGTLKIKKVLNIKKLRQTPTLKSRMHALSCINSTLDHCYCSFRSSQILRVFVYTLILKNTQCILWSIFLRSREHSGDETFQRMFPRTLQVKSLWQRQIKYEKVTFVVIILLGLVLTILLFSTYIPYNHLWNH